MTISRSQPTTLHSTALAQEMSKLQGPCIGCRDCLGLCRALIDALVVPDVVLSRKREIR